MPTATAPPELVAAASPGNDNPITLHQALERLAPLASLPGAQGWHIVLAGRALAEGLDIAAVSLRQFTAWTGRSRSTYFSFRKSALFAEIQALCPAVQPTGPCMGTNGFKESLEHSTPPSHDPTDRTDGPAVDLALKRLAAISWGLRAGYRVEEPADLIVRHGARSVLYACFCARGKRSPAGFVRWHLETAGKTAPEGWEDPDLRQTAVEPPHAPAAGLGRQPVLEPVPASMSPTAPEFAPLHAAIDAALPQGVQAAAVAVEGGALRLWIAAASFIEYHYRSRLEGVAAACLGAPTAVAFAEAAR